MNENHNDLITVIPLAASLIESIRSIGYSFETAIADIIDNSISANAQKIDIFLDSYSVEPFVQILDNGTGMSKNEMIEAMRLGSKNPIEKREEGDLGRFGLGLKSASFSQCKVLTLISKKDGEINGLQWDLDLVQLENKFIVKQLGSQEINQHKNINELEKSASGTIVQWEKFDRIADSTNDIKDELNDLMNFTMDHLSLIFHRFINEGIVISVNNTNIVAKDPFLKTHKATQELQSKEIIIEKERISLYPFVLPHYSKLNSIDKEKAGKVSEQYKSQGFYLYRNKRLIIWGDYLGLTRKNELTKNLRIQVDLPNSLDYLWEIDVKKSRAKVPSKIKRNLLSAINAGEVTSKRVNKFKGRKELKKENPLWELFEEREEEFYLEVNKENKLYKQFIQSLNESQNKLFDIFIEALSKNLPYQTIYAQIGEGKKMNFTNENIVDELKEKVRYLETYANIDVKAWLESLQYEEPYTSDKLSREYIKSMLEG